MTSFSYLIFLLQFFFSSSRLAVCVVSGTHEDRMKTHEDTQQRIHVFVTVTKSTYFFITAYNIHVGTIRKLIFHAYIIGTLIIQIIYACRNVYDNTDYIRGFCRPTQMHLIWLTRPNIVQLRPMTQRSRSCLYTINLRLSTSLKFKYYN